MSKRKISIEEQILKAKLHAYNQEQISEAEALQEEKPNRKDMTKLSCKCESGSSFIVYRSDIDSGDQQRQLIEHFRSRGYGNFKVNGRKYRE